MSDPLGTEYAALTAHSLLFQVLDERGRQAVLLLARRTRVPAGTVLIREGEVGAEVYLLREGVAKVTAQRGDQEIELGELSSGVIVGEVAEMGHVPRTATVTALSDLDLLKFHGPALVDLLRRYPAAEKVLNDIIAHRAQDTIRKLVR